MTVFFLKKNVWTGTKYQGTSIVEPEATTILMLQLLCGCWRTIKTKAKPQKWLYAGVQPGVRTMKNGQVEMRWCHSDILNKIGINMWRNNIRTAPKNACGWWHERERRHEIEVHIRWRYLERVTTINGLPSVAEFYPVTQRKIRKVGGNGYVIRISNLAPSEFIPKLNQWLQNNTSFCAYLGVQGFECCMMISENHCLWPWA